MSDFEYEYIASEESALGVISLRLRDLPSHPQTQVTEITLDHALLMSSHNTASERALASSALALHSGANLNVLVGGLGLGYTAQAVLESGRVAHLEVVEYLAPVVRWLEQGLIPLSAELQADPRLDVTEGDVYGQLWGAPTRQWDAILIDVDHSPDERLGSESDRFYTEEGLRRAQEHLAPDGVLGVWSYAGCAPFADALARVFADVRVEPVTFQNRVFDQEETNEIFLAWG